MPYFNARIYDLGKGDFEAKFSESGWVKDSCSQYTSNKDYNKPMSPRGYSPDREENRIKQVTKSKGNIRRLVTRHSLSRKWELTFAENIQDVGEADYHFRNFMKRIRRKHPELKYVTTREFQDKYGRGAVHYHLAVNIFVVKKEFDKIWGNGFTWMKAYDDTGKEGKIYSYITKYLTKYSNDERLKGHHLYLCSQGLQVPYKDMFFESKDDFMNYLKDKYPKIHEKYIRFYEDAGLLVVI
jgi:uncharacterized short protein YbdD (DUF466 family)